VILGSEGKEEFRMPLCAGSHSLTVALVCACPLVQCRGCNGSWIGMSHTSYIKVTVTLSSFTVSSHSTTLARPLFLCAPPSSYLIFFHFFFLYYNELVLCRRTIDLPFLGRLRSRARYSCSFSILRVPTGGEHTEEYHPSRARLRL